MKGFGFLTTERGLIFVINNMLEKKFTVDPVIRQAAADTELGIVWLRPGSDALRNGSAAAAIDTVWKNLADESGYGEIAFAPLIVEEHSAAPPFVWGIQGQMPVRIIAAIPRKGYNAWGPARRIPNLKGSSE